MSDSDTSNQTQPDEPFSGSAEVRPWAGMEEFKIGPDYLNEVFDEAGIEDMRMTKTLAGQLHLDTELSGVETINRLVSGLALLYGKLYTARRNWA